MGSFLLSSHEKIIKIRKAPFFCFAIRHKFCKGLSIMSGEPFPPAGGQAQLLQSVVCHSERGCGVCNQFRPPASEKRNAVSGTLLRDRGFLLLGYRACARYVRGINGRVGGPLWRRVSVSWRRRLFFLPLFFSPQPVRLPARACSPGNRLHRIFLCDPVICACGL